MKEGSDEDIKRGKGHTGLGISQKLGWIIYQSLART